MAMAVPFVPTAWVQAAQAYVRGACAHPLATGGLVCIGLAPFLVAPQQVTLQGLAQPLGVALGSCLGARLTARTQGATSAFVRLFGTVAGAAVAVGLAHVLDEVTACTTGPVACVPTGLLYGFSGACSAVLGALLGITAWRGVHAPVSSDLATRAMAVVGAYAVSGLGLTTLIRPHDAT